MEAEGQAGDSGDTEAGKGKDPSQGPATPRFQTGCLTTVREVLDVLSPLVCGTLLKQPQESSRR